MFLVEAEPQYHDKSIGRQVLLLVRGLKPHIHLLQGPNMKFHFFRIHEFYSVSQLTRTPISTSYAWGFRAKLEIPRFSKTKWKIWPPKLRALYTPTHAGGQMITFHFFLSIGGPPSGFPDRSEYPKTFKSPDPRIGPLREKKNSSSKYIQYAKIGQTLSFLFESLLKSIAFSYTHLTLPTSYSA